MPDRINLVTGDCFLLAALGYAVALLAAIGITTTESPWAWKGAALVFLAAVFWFSIRSTSETRINGTGMLRLDGTASYSQGREEVLLEYTGQAWVSRLFSVIHFRETDSGRKCSWLVCADNNHTDDYRRMLGYLRLGSGSMVEADEV